jgi:hypothetical protein
MLASLPIIIAFLIAVGIPPVRLSRKFIKIHWWDYALPAIGLPVWIFLTFAEIGETASLSNMVIFCCYPMGKIYDPLLKQKFCCGNLSNYVSNSVCRNSFSQVVHAYAA